MAKEQIAIPGLDGTRIPRHIAIIMDGNGRWAKKRLMPRTMGHRAGVERLKEIVRFASDLGVEDLTLYAFSTENWKRPKEEVGVLMGLIVEYLNREIAELCENGVKFNILGDWSALPGYVQDTVRYSIESTRQNTGIRMNVALNYGGRAELVRACQRLAGRVEAGELKPGEITEEKLEQELYTHGLAPVDLLIRTGGEIRLSNFLLYQAAYAELYFTDTLWPDFDSRELIKAILNYQSRDRRYGGLS